MRIESSVTTVSWIPSEAVTGPVLKGTFEAGFTHYDDPPPDVIDDLEACAPPGGSASPTTSRRGSRSTAAASSTPGTRAAASWARRRCTSPSSGAPSSRSPLPDIRHDPERSDTEVRFVQTTGGRTGLPAPRRVKHPPFVQFRAPTVWTTLALTIRADGTSSFEVLGASKFPRHWVYDADGKLAAKVGLADFKDWYRDAFGKHTPWGDRDSKALVTAVETALERQLSVTIMSGGATTRDPHGEAGEVPRRAGRPGRRDLPGPRRRAVGRRSTARPVAEVGPGAILGERAVLEGGVRTASLPASTDVRVAVASRRPDRPRRVCSASSREEPPTGGTDRGRTTGVGNVAGCGSPPGTSTR